MTTDRRFERDLSAQLRDLYLGPIPDYRDDVLAVTSRKRQRPAWTFPERWLPMAVVDRRRFFAPHVPLRGVAALALLGLILAALLGLFVVGQHRVPAPFGLARNGQIVYSAGDDIYVRDTPGAAPHLLIGGPTLDRAPTFSRQGDRFTFFRMVDNDHLDVWIANADGSGARKLAGPIANPPSWDWSPDGRSIVTVDDIKGVGTIVVIPTDGSAVRYLDVGMMATVPTWRPNHDEILFRGGDPGLEGDLFLVRPDGTGLKKLPLPKQGIGEQHDFGHGYSWSPDGRRIAYELVDTLDEAKTGVKTGLRIHVAEVDAAGGVLSERRLEFDPLADNELQPAWLPTGDRVVFQTREGNDDYLSVAPDPTGSASGSGAGTATRVGPASSAGSGIGYEIAPDGRSLLVLFWSEKKAWRYDLETLEATPADLGVLDVSSYQRLAP